MNELASVTISTPSLFSGAGLTAFLIGIIAGIVLTLFISRR